VRLLVVEDDVKLAAAVGRGLRHAGYAVDVAGDGEAALRHAAVWEYDAVVLDLMLPERDGFEVCATLRGRGCWAPVLMLTARDRVEDRIRGLDSGADDYLAKPFDFGELLARIRALVRRAPAARPAAIEAGELRVDPASREVTLSGRRVELTAREFAVLEVLARNAGDVVTRAQLLDHVWDMNFEGSTNIVDQYVGALRRKLGATLIQTVRGAGFRLVGA
jgi:two-component system, OmpR family, response regulator